MKSKRFYFPRHLSLAGRLALRTAPPNEQGCALWTGPLDRDGYGQIRYKGETYQTNRAAWVAANGPIPAGMCSCHRCDNPPCMTIGHLFLGTNADNMADRDAKGRQGRSRGSANGASKLTESQVRFIRMDVISAHVLAADYGVSRGLIYAVRRRQIWKHLD